MSNVVVAKDLWKIYSMGRGVEVRALRGLNLAVEQGEFISLVGPSGSGKSSLLHIIGCIDSPSQGDIHLNGSSVAGMKDKRRTEIRLKEIGFVFQTFNLMPTLDALGNVEIPMRLAGTRKRQRREKAKEILARVGLGERLHHRPNQLSGGERQRVAIARALANSPKLVLADEPTGNLDSATSGEIVDLLQDLNRGRQTIILVTHDLEIAKYATRTLHMVDGQIVEDTS